MTPRDTRYRRLLNWYPHAWRDAHGEVVLATMLDAADDAGRDAPALGETWSAMVGGLGHRLDRRVALVCAIVASIVAIAMVPLRMLPLGWQGGAFDVVLSALGHGFAPLLAVAAVIAGTRARGWCSPGSALLGVALSVPATALTALAVLSWSVGFDEADAGVPRSAFAGAFLGLVAAAWLCSAAVCAVVGGSALRGAGVPAGWSLLAGAVAGLVAYPFVAFAQVSPVTVALIALGSLAAVALLGAGPARRATDGAGRGRGAASGTVLVSASRDAGPRASLRPIARGWIIVCAAVSAAASLLAVAFALTGSQWPGVVADSTQAMRLGIAGALLAALPLCVAVGLARTARHAPLGAWGPAALLGIALGIAASENLTGTGDGDRIVVVLMIAALPLGGAVAWIIAAGRWSTPGVRGTIAVACGAVVVVQGVGLQMLAFAVPVVAVVLGLVLARPRRAAASAPPVSSPIGQGR